MIDSKLRGRVQPAFDVTGRIFIWLKMSPDTITILAFVVGVLSGLSLAMGHLIPGVVLLWLSGLLDVLDGTVARLIDKSSKVGAFMDLILDRMVEAAVILGFAYLFPDHMFAYLLFFVAVIFNFTTFMVAGALFENEGGKSMHYDVGIAERTETFIVFTLMAMFPDYLYTILMIFNGIVFLTGMIRFFKVIRYSREIERYEC